MKDLLSKEFLKKLGELLYKDVVYPLAKAYVEKTDNKYDDAGLDFLDNFVKDLLKGE